MKSSRLVLSYPESINFLNKSTSIHNTLSLNPARREYQYINSEATIKITLTLPVLLHILYQDPLDQFHSGGVYEKIPTYLIILIRAGHAALAFCKRGEIFYHKVIKKYMVRKKQGKAQITYHALKGKARGGARLRLSRTREFFEEIGAKINEWPTTRANWILYQSSPRLWGELFRTKKSPPFNRTDSRIRKIPLNTYVPTFREIIRINRLLLNGNIVIKAPEKVESIDYLVSLILT